MRSEAIGSGTHRARWCAYVPSGDANGLPFLLVHTGGADYNAAPGLAGKYVARVQAATSGGRPVLWDLSRDGGHESYLFGGPGPMADALAFLLWQLGDPAFQRTPRADSPAGR